MQRAGSGGRPHDVADDTGAAAVEMALVLPILMLLLFGTVQFGLAFFEWQGLQAGAREGARLAAFSGSPQWSDVEDRVLDASATVKGGALAVELDQAGVWTTPSAAAVVCDGGTDEIRLRVRYVDDYQIQAVFFTQSIQMSAEAVFRCENAR